MGSAFKQYPLGKNSTIVDETPTGTINGSNTAFTTANDYVSGTLAVYKNGVRMQEGASNDFTESSSNGFTMTTAPATGDILLVDYTQSLTNRGNADTLDGYQATDLLNRDNHTGRLKWASVRRTANQSISNATFTEVSFDTEIADDPGWFTATSTDIVVDEAGLYDISAFIFFGGTTGGRRLMTIYINGANTPEMQDYIYEGTPDSTIRVGLSASIKKVLAANDTVSVAVYQSSGGALNLEDASLQVVKLSD